MKSVNGISIVIPAYNEEGTIRIALENVVSELKGKSVAYEILLVDDGSTDKTLHYCRELMRRYPHTRIIRRKINEGLGRAFMDGVRNAKFPYVTAFHGDNEASSNYIGMMIRNIGSADILNTYPIETEKRPVTRRIISALFTLGMNALFRTDIRYPNGVIMCRTDLIRGMDVISKGFTVYAEIKIRLINLGYTCREFPFRYMGRRSGRSKALRFHSITDTIQTMIRLFMLVRSSEKSISSRTI